MRDLVHLPHDLFLLILSYLPPTTCIVCRAVSRQWHRAFTDPSTSLRLLRWNFPRCREFRLLDPDHTTYAATFAHVARRYYHLGYNRPHAIETLPIAGPADGLSFCGVATWNRYLREGDKTCDFHYPDPVWSYSQHDALLVYPRPSSGDGRLYHIWDPATGHHVPVPFDVGGKHIRRVRLAHGVLVFEWAEAFAYHQLNDREFVHRHFVTAFNVSPAAETGVEVTFLSEWKLHFLGLPLNRSDRFFSVHNRTHYAAYIWQPNRSLYNDDPIEQLAVWDLSSPSPAPAPSPSPTPPVAPAGTGLWTAPTPPSPRQSVSPQPDETSPPPQPEQLPPPQPEQTPTPQQPPPAKEPTMVPPVVCRLSWRDLDVYGLRQGNTPQLRELRLDAHNVYFVEEEHSSSDGQHSSPPAGLQHIVRCTGVPLSFSPESVVYGPAWVDECGGPHQGRTCRGMHEEQHQRFAPCWRHRRWPCLMVSWVADDEAGVSFMAIMCGNGKWCVYIHGDICWEEEVWGELMGKGRMEGEERWLLGETEDGSGVTIWRF